MIARLRRLFACRIYIPMGREMRRFRIVEHYSLDGLQGHVSLRFSPEFRITAQNGVVVPLPQLRALSTKPFALEVFVKLLLILGEGRYAESWDLRRELRSSGTRQYFVKRLRWAFELIGSMWPKNPFWVDGVCVACKPSAYRAMAHGIDVEAERRALEAELAGMSRAEVRAYILCQPEWRRAKMYSDYLYGSMYPEAMALAEKSCASAEQAAACVRALDAVTGQLQTRPGDNVAVEAAGEKAAADESGEPITVALDTSTAADGVAAAADGPMAETTAESSACAEEKAPPDVALPVQPCPAPGFRDTAGVLANGTAAVDSTDGAAPAGAMVAAAQSNKATVESDTAAPEQDAAVCATTDASTPTAPPDAGPIPTGREPQMASSTTSERDVQVSGEPDHRREPSSRQRIGALISQAAARIPGVRVLIPRVAGLASKPRQTPDDPPEPAATAPPSWRRRTLERARAVMARDNRTRKRRPRRRRTSDGDAGPSG